MTCLRCGGELTAPTLFDPTEGYARVHFQAPSTGGWFASERESFTIDRARICLSCGQVDLSLSQATLARLRERMPVLSPLDAER